MLTPGIAARSFNPLVRGLGVLAARGPSNQCPYEGFRKSGGTRIFCLNFPAHSR